MRTVSEKTYQARKLRRNYTDVELLLWQKLRRKQLNGLKFRRQQPIGSYIVDFVCYEQNLIIELDGGQHSQEADILYDTNRTGYLETLGYTVIRFWNNEVIENIEGVLEKIQAYSPHPDPLPQERENREEIILRERK